MSIFSASLSYNNFANQNSAAGSNSWGVASGADVTVLPASQGSQWIIWGLLNSAAAVGEAFNGVNITCTIDFTVGGGGGGITRVASLWGDVRNAFNFTNQAGTATGASAVGTGTGNNPNFNMNKAGITSTDLKNGNFFVGFYVTTGGQNTGDGTFRISGARATCYFGTDTPGGGSGGSGSTKMTLTNPASNNNPGQYNGTTFASLTSQLTAPVPTLSYSHDWGVQAPLRFPNGTQSFSELKGQNNGNSYVSQSGIITIPAGTPAGNYSITCVCSVTSNAVQSASLIVLPTRSGLFYEF
jgi:hypothetical protein